MSKNQPTQKPEARMTKGGGKATRGASSSAGDTPSGTEMRQRTSLTVTGRLRRHQRWVGSECRYVMFFFMFVFLVCPNHCICMCIIGSKCQGSSSP